MLLPPSNEIFVPASEPRFRFTAGATWVLAPFTGLGAFHSHKFSNPGAAGENACGFLRRLFERIIESA